MQAHINMSTRLITHKSNRSIYDFLLFLTDLLPIPTVESLSDFYICRMLVFHTFRDYAPKSLILYSVEANY